jgi:tRNA pseudouridine13 synthase
MLRGDPEEAVDLLLGRPASTDSDKLRHARELYEQGQYQQAARLWPGMFRDEKRALHALDRGGGNKRRALMAVNEGLRRLYVSAYQSHLFNRLVAMRLPEGLDRLWEGDLAWVHSSGAVFSVRNAPAEQERAERFEISPSGPLFGYRMTEPQGQAGELEAGILVKEELKRDAFRAGPLRVKGARRPLRFQPAGAEVRLGADEQGVYLELEFSLPRGCYATSLLRELFRERPELEADATGMEPG